MRSNTHVQDSISKSFNFAVRQTLLPGLRGHTAVVYSRVIDETNFQRYVSGKCQGILTRYIDKKAAILFPEVPLQNKLFIARLLRSNIGIGAFSYKYANTPNHLRQRPGGSPWHDFHLVSTLAKGWKCSSTIGIHGPAIYFRTTKISRCTVPWCGHTLNAQCKTTPRAWELRFTICRGFNAL